MFKVTKVLAIILVSLTTLTIKANANTPKVLFTDGKGTQISTEAAFQLSSKDQTVYRCQPVKASLNKSDTSISFKVVRATKD